MTSSQRGTSTIARTMTSSPERSVSGATASSLGRPLRLATGPSGRNSSVSTPYGTTRMDALGTPSLASSAASPDELARTALTLRAIRASSRSRACDPEMGMRDIRRGLAPAPHQLTAECRHVRQYLVGREAAGRPGGQVLDRYPGGHV